MAIDLCCSTFGGARPRELAAKAVLSGLSAPEIRRPPMVARLRGAFFFVAVCGDEGEDELSAPIAESRFLEDRGVIC